MRFTVFTPTYNRGYIIEQLYDSLCRQTFRDFEWVVVDDGSVDNTEEVMERIMARDNFFPVIYRKQPNGGKHRAWNRGVELASGELFFGCDSDDYLTDDALEIADRVERAIPKAEKAGFAGICGLRAHRDSTMIGASFSDAEYMDMTHLERMKNNVKGDKSEVIYTAVWKKYKYHEFEGEKFITEATALNRMAADGLKMRYFNETVKICEYLADGLSASSQSQFRNSPRGYGLYLHQQIEHGLLRGRNKWRAIANYYSQCNAALGLKTTAEYLYMSPVMVIAISRAMFLTWRIEGIVSRLEERSHGGA